MRNGSQTDNMRMLPLAAPNLAFVGNWSKAQLYDRSYRARAASERRAGSRPDLRFAGRGSSPCRSTTLSIGESRAKGGGVNPKAWSGKPIQRKYRDAIIRRFKRHVFTREDLDAILDALIDLRGFGNIKAWQSVRSHLPEELLCQTVAGQRANALSALDDFGNERPAPHSFVVEARPGSNEKCYCALP
jgi:hypothetical protein